MANLWDKPIAVMNQLVSAGTVQFKAHVKDDKEAKQALELTKRYAKYLAASKKTAKKDDAPPSFKEYLERHPEVVEHVIPNATQANEPLDQARKRIVDAAESVAGSESLVQQAAGAGESIIDKGKGLLEGTKNFIGDHLGLFAGILPIGVAMFTGAPINFMTVAAAIGVALLADNLVSGAAKKDSVFTQGVKLVTDRFQGKPEHAQAKERTAAGVNPKDIDGTTRVVAFGDIAAQPLPAADTHGHGATHMLDIKEKGHEVRIYGKVSGDKFVATGMRTINPSKQAEDSNFTPLTNEFALKADPQKPGTSVVHFDDMLSGQMRVMADVNHRVAHAKAKSDFISGNVDITVDHDKGSKQAVIIIKSKTDASVARTFKGSLDGQGAFVITDVYEKIGNKTVELDLVGRVTLKGVSKAKQIDEGGLTTGENKDRLLNLVKVSAPDIHEQNMVKTLFIPKPKAKIDEGTLNVSGTGR